MKLRKNDILTKVLFVSTFSTFLQKVLFLFGDFGFCKHAAFVQFLQFSSIIRFFA